MSKITRYLIVNVAGECRITKRYPSLAWNEIGYQLDIEAPAGWGQMVERITLELPAPMQQVKARLIEGERA